MNRVVAMVVAVILIGGCRSTPPAHAASEHTNEIGGNQSGPGNGSPDVHGPGHDDRTMSVNGLH